MVYNKIINHGDQATRQGHIKPPIPWSAGRRERERAAEKERYGGRERDRNRERERETGVRER